LQEKFNNFVIGMVTVLVVGIAVVTRNAFAARNIGGSVSGPQDNDGHGGNFNTGGTHKYRPNWWHANGNTGGTDNGGGL